MIDHLQIEESIQGYIGADSILGMAIALVRGEEVVYCNGFGTTSIEDGGSPITPRTIFAIGSTSKTISALMIMRLVEQGILHLDRPVVDYLPGYVFWDNPQWGKRVTLRHLLGHTSGLASGFTAWGPRDLDALQRWVWDEMALFAFLAEPGRTTYYGCGPCLAAHVAEAVSGKYFPQLVEDQVFAPLGMHRSTYDRRVAMTYPLALPHERGEDGRPVTVHHYPDNPARNPDGLCLSTAGDLANVLTMLLNRGRFRGVQYLTPESVATMQMPHGDYLARARDDVRWAMLLYEGLGLNIGHYKGVHSVGHWGRLQSMVAMFDLFPEKGLGVVCLTNWCDLAKRIGMIYEVYDRFLGTPSSYHFPQPTALSEDEHTAARRQVEGTYLAPSGGIVTVSVNDGRLTIAMDNETRVLTAVNAEQYYFEDDQGHRTPVSFLTEASGPAQIVMVDFGLFSRSDTDASTTLDSATLARYEGLYANYREGSTIDGFYVRVLDDSLYLFPAENQGLRVELDRSEGLKCRALGSARFVCDSGLYDFEVGSDGSVSYVRKDLALRYWRVPDV
jgi:CubicO group peptidase (beta-lactamase class C family)